MVSYRGYLIRGFMFHSMLVFKCFSHVYTHLELIRASSLLYYIVLYEYTSICPPIYELYGYCGATNNTLEGDRFLP